MKKKPQKPKQESLRENKVIVIIAKPLILGIFSR